MLSLERSAKPLRSSRWERSPSSLFCRRRRFNLLLAVRIDLFEQATFVVEFAAKRRNAARVDHLREIVGESLVLVAELSRVELAIGKRIQPAFVVVSLVEIVS